MREIVRLCGRGAQRGERCPSLLHGLPKRRPTTAPWRDACESGSAGGARASSATNLASLDRLQERVMEIPRHASALRQSVIEAGTDNGMATCRSLLPAGRKRLWAMNMAETMHRTRNRVCLIPGGRNTEVQGCSPPRSRRCCYCMQLPETGTFQGEGRCRKPGVAFPHHASPYRGLRVCSESVPPAEPQSLAPCSQFRDRACSAGR